MKKKEKKKSPQQHKQDVVQQKNCYLKRIKAMMGIMGDESAFKCLGQKGVAMLYFARIRPVKFISPDDPKQRVDKLDLDFMNDQLNRLLRNSFVELGSDKKQVCLYDFFYITETLFLFYRNATKDICLDPESFRQKLTAFTDDYQQIRLNALTILQDRLDFLSWTFSQNTRFNIRAEAQPKKESTSPFDQSVFFNNYIIYFEKPETELVEIDGHNRTVFQVGVYRNNSLIRIALTLEQLGIPGFLQKLPLKVFIQIHAIERLKERVGDYFMGLSYMEVFSTLLNNKPCRTDDGGLLFPYSYLNKKLGYLKASVIGDKIIIRTFLFLTNNGTPEGKKLAAILGVQKEDKKYLGIDKLSTFINSDIEENENLKRIFIQAGCSSLFEMKKYMNEKPDQAMQCANYLSHYLGLLKQEEVLDIPV